MAWWITGAIPSSLSQARGLKNVALRVAVSGDVL
jgi:hypothetical protein